MSAPFAGRKPTDAELAAALAAQQNGKCAYLAGANLRGMNLDLCSANMRGTILIHLDDRRGDARRRGTNLGGANVARTCAVMAGVAALCALGRARGWEGCE